MKTNIKDPIENVLTIRSYFKLKYNDDLKIVTTYAPGITSEYFRYVSLTVKCIYKGKLTCYLCYRSKIVNSKDQIPKQSSIEIFNNFYVSIRKIHYSDFSTDEEFIIELIKEIEKCL